MCGEKESSCMYYNIQISLFDEECSDHSDSENNFQVKTIGEYAHLSPAFVASLSACTLAILRDQASGSCLVPAIHHA